jgi:hypothetical protein
MMRRTIGPLVSVLIVGVTSLAAGFAGVSSALAQAPPSDAETLREEVRTLRERLNRLEQAQQPRILAAAPVSAPPLAQAPPPTPSQQPAPVPGEREIQLEREHPLETLGLAKPEIADARISGFFAGSPSYNSHIQMVPEFAGSGQALADPKSVNFRFEWVLSRAGSRSAFDRSGPAPTR